MTSKKMRTRRQPTRKRSYKTSRSVIGFSWSRRYAQSTWTGSKERRRRGGKSRKRGKSCLSCRSRKLSKNLRYRNRYSRKSSRRGGAKWKRKRGFYRRS